MYDVGVIIGRFQVHKLHEGHHKLIETVVSNHKRVLLFLGVSVIENTKRNPLDFFTRKLMIEKDYPNIIVLPLADNKSDIIWSQNLDEKIREIIKYESILLYGSRDSFIPYYHGSFETKEIETNIYTSGAEVRNSLKNETRASEDFRAGLIYGTFHKYDISYTTVDVAILNGNEVLLARKFTEDKYRFVGGFVDVKDTSLEHTVKREVSEETHIEIDDIRYLFSQRIDDWRYHSETDKILTTFFVAKYIFGKPEPDDDIHELKWFHIEALKETDFVEEHKILYKKLKEFLNLKKGV